MYERLLSLLKAIIFVNLLLFTNNICQACDGPLGMANGNIKDWQITASSTFPAVWDPNCHEKYSRLYLENGKAWCAKQKSDSEWLQIDLGVAAKISGVIVQGRSGKKEWVVSFMISYSTDAFQWMYITDKYGNQRVFQGNVDDFSLKHNYFDKSIRARFIKFHTIEWSKHPSLRVEIIGCQECNQILGLPPYGKFSASSTWPTRNKHTCQPSDGSLLSNKGWCAKRKNADQDQWLELDIGHPTLVTGLVTKGRGDSIRNQWITRYKVSYSNDTEIWTFYKDANHLEPKEFGGNADKQMERTHYLNNPFSARFIRFHPIEWNEHLAMRAAVLGCPYKGACLPGYFRVNEDSNCVANIAFRKDVWTNERKSIEKRNKLKSPMQRSFMTLVQQGHASLAVDGDYDTTLQKCAIMDNYYTERPIMIIDMGKITSVGGVVITTWQGKGQDSNFSYRDYMYSLDRFSVFVDRRPLNNNNQNANNSSISLANSLANSSKLRLNEYNLCNFVTRNNFAVFAPQITLQCTKPLHGRYVYIQADGRNNRWSKLFSAVLCEVQVFEL